MRVAFLGLGHMGLPMARNLVGAGHDVVGFDVVPGAREAARASGLRVVNAATDAVADAEVVITMFAAGHQVIDAYRGGAGRPGLLAAAPGGILFVDCSTIAVDEARAAHALAEAAGLRSVDAPVSGGVVGAENATLTFMVGGARADVDAARPLLEVMGARVVHCGGPGLGQAAKVCNNMILAASQIVVAEAFVLGERLGLSHQALFDVAAHASGQCWALTTNCPVPGPVPSSPANRGFEPGFAGALMDKDLGLAEKAVELTGVDARMGMLARTIYREFVDGGGAGRDFSGIIESVRAPSDDPRSTA
ncbi:MAG: 3-hydroxyisobutyrate dehydrogenase [Zunongwangia sp.]|uniref:3-hydroxyisobutyrate dehydrogenase n=1 Tax=Microbacterium sp. UBA3394 TaxID=1946945 RepID=UPI000C4EEF1C|nr:3-hydroxyisobutyrate dehydrogenase [Microbacterium sp. UBA3394]MAM54299.1 3-hydroxyisobutyrate dehydrogenase [Microbacterium sp.]MAO34823.1 3-hydroxyisobutyrate dehydrogenase [Zunongwangia sp.]HAS33318.1 3-hydroxyisobutyrate dehydrogenase [Microbacterium sp.]|tara:strand:- start:3746 stop:4663 length:918 start_codon:yes stop_codon:yes gene_type:complete